MHSLILHSNFEIRDDEELCKVIYFRDSLKKSIHEMNLASTCYEQFCIKPRVKHVGGGHATTQDGQFAYIKQNNYEVLSALTTLLLYFTK